MKTQKKEKKQSGERGVRKISIRTKLSLIFLVPVICMVALGIISYYQAANVVIENSKRETGQTLSVLAEAYQTKFEMVQSQIDEYYQDMDMREYLSGAYNLFDTKAVQYYNASLSAVKSKVWSNPSISGIEIVAGKTDSVLYNEHKNDNLYQELSATKLGETLLADKQKYHWFGKSGEVDEMMGIDGADYLFRVGMHFPKHEAYVVAQMPEQTVADIIKELTFGENSIVGVLSANGTELIYDGEKTDTENGIFGTYLLGNNRVESKEYVEYNGVKYLLLYSTVVEDEIWVCVLIPEAYFLQQAYPIRNITVALVIIAAVLAYLVGTVFAGNLTRCIRRTNAHMDRLSGGDFTFRLQMKRRDEFGLLAERVNHMTDNVCGLIGEISGAGVVLLLIGLLGSPAMLRLLNTKEDLLPGAILYLRVYFLGMPALALYNFGNAVFSSIGDTKKPLLYLSIAGALNIALNLFFVIVCDLSVVGVALASAISQCVSAFLILRALTRVQDCYALDLHKLQLDPAQAKSILALGVPAGLQNAIFAIANLFIQAGVNSFDSLMVKGNSAAANADALIYDCMAAFYMA